MGEPTKIEVSLETKEDLLKKLRLTNLNDATAIGQKAKSIIKDSSAHRHQWRNSSHFFHEVLEMTNLGVRWIRDLVKNVHLAKGECRYN